MLPMQLKEKLLYAKVESHLLKNNRMFDKLILFVKMLLNSNPTIKEAKKNIVVKKKKKK